MKVFIVEDDDVIATAVAKHIEAWGYRVKIASDFRNVLGEFAAFDPQLVLLDIGLPFYNGYHWCSQIRQVSKVPIIFISSASDNMNIVMAVSTSRSKGFAIKSSAPIFTAMTMFILSEAEEIKMIGTLETCRIWLHQW